MPPSPDVERWRALSRDYPNGPFPCPNWFVALKMQSITAKKEALQRLGISKNLAGSMLSFYCEEIVKLVDRASETSVKLGDQTCKLGIALCHRPKSIDLRDGILPFV